MSKAEKASPKGHPILSYRGPASGARYELWREEFGRKIMNVDFAPLSDGLIACDVMPADLGKVRLAGSTGSPIKFTSVGRDDTLVLIYSPTAAVDSKMGKREASLDRGAFVLGDSSIAGAFASQLESGHFRTILLDRAALLSICPNAEEKVGLELHDDPVAGALLKSYFDALTASASQISPHAAAIYGQHLIDLAALALGAKGNARDEAQNRSLNSARLNAVKQTVLARLTEPGLSLAELARIHRVSPRTIQLLFEAEGESFSEFVLEQRLLTAYRLLVNPMHAHRKVSDVAHSAGFGDVSHFHKYFRRRFGATPADVRSNGVQT